MQKKEYYQIVEELFSKNIMLAIRALEFLEEIKDGKIDIGFINAICMKKSRDFINIYDAHIICTIHELIKNDLIWYTKIEIGFAPFRDKFKKENNEFSSYFPINTKQNFFITPELHFIMTDTSN